MLLRFWRVPLNLIERQNKRGSLQVNVATVQYEEEDIAPLRDPVQIR